MPDARTPTHTMDINIDNSVWWWDCTVGQSTSTNITDCFQLTIPFDDFTLEAISGKWQQAHFNRQIATRVAALAM